MRVILLNDIGAPLDIANRVQIPNVQREQVLALRDEEVARKMFENVRQHVAVTDPAKVRVLLLTKNPEFAKHALIVAPPPNWKRLNFEKGKEKDPEHYAAVASEEAERLSKSDLAILVDDVASTMFGQKRLEECGKEFERKNIKTVLAAGVLVFPATDFNPEPVRRKILCGFEANACIRMSDLVSSKSQNYPELTPYLKK
ncbi:hypothetical protein HY546_03210 [archaeon]|nr:hypothetical protein [archaeon]